MGQCGLAGTVVGHVKYYTHHVTGNNEGNGGGSGSVIAGDVHSGGGGVGVGGWRA